jgi:DNA (cytosine-5)-methyltransferase 1
MKRGQRPIAVDLFCGAGGMSLGFEQAGFEIAAAVDSDPIHAEAHAQNFPSCKTITADISTLTGRELRAFAGLRKRHIDVVFGGPPCQGFSLIGKRKLRDPRNKLLFEFVRLVRELQPSYFVCENVEGLAQGKARAVLDSFVRRAKRAGYEVVEPIQALDARGFGVPQNRRRVFILGYRRGLQRPIYPKPFNINGDGPSVWAAIRDLAGIGKKKRDSFYGTLPNIVGYAAILRGEKRDPDDLSLPRQRNGAGLTGCLKSEHTAKSIRRFTTTEPGGFETVSRFHRLSKLGAANTIRAGTGSSNGSFTAARPIHPTQARCITVREAARLHSYPDWFQFDQTVWHGFRQVGNSVPPLLARSVAKCIAVAIACPTEHARCAPA